MKTTKRKPGRPRKDESTKIAKAVKASSENPFQIVDGISLSSTKGSKSNLTNQLLEAISKLPVDHNKSVYLPKSIVSDKKNAAALMSAVKRMISLSPSFSKDFTITLRTEKDANNNYNGSRIWRIA